MREAYAMGAKTGNPKATAQLCAWEEAEQGSIPLKQTLKVHNTTLSRVQKQMDAHEKDPDNYQEPEMEADLDHKSLDEANIEVRMLVRKPDIQGPQSILVK